jgi:hypothetical protein
LIVVPRPLPRCTAQVFDRGAQAAARGAAQALDRGAQNDARGVACCALQVLDRGVQAVASGAARGASQVFDRGAQAVAGGAATLSQQSPLFPLDFSTPPQQYKHSATPNQYALGAPTGTTSSANMAAASPLNPF